LLELVALQREIPRKHGVTWGDRKRRTVDKCST
jgi:hypothetical protein